VKLKLHRADTLAFDLLGFKEWSLLVGKGTPEKDIIRIGLRRKAACQGCNETAGVKQIGKWVAVLCESCAAAVYMEGKHYCLPAREKADGKQG
jgi:hypothetical protein